MSDQVRKAINVSLQSKKYSESINEIIKDWEEQELNISAETCEALLLVHRLKKLSSRTKPCELRPRWKTYRNQP